MDFQLVSKRPIYLSKSVDDFSRFDRLNDSHLANEEAGGQHSEDENEKTDETRGQKYHPDVLKVVLLP